MLILFKKRLIVLFRIPKTGEIDSSEQSKTDLVLKSTYNLMGVLNLILIIFIFPLIIEIIFKLNIYEITHTYKASFLIATLVSFIALASSTYYIFHEKHIPTKKIIYLHIIMSIINTLWLITNFIFFYF